MACTLRNLCLCNDVENVLDMLKTTNETQVVTEDLFIDVCRLGFIDLAKQLYVHNNQLRFYEYDNAAFRWACCNGFLDVSQWLYDLHREVYNHDIDDSCMTYAFFASCEKGQLKTLQWLLTVCPSIDVSYLHEMPFRAACQHGHLEVAKWLIKVKPDIEVGILNCTAFATACRKGHLEVAQWLFNLHKPTCIPDFVSNPKVLDWLHQLEFAVEKNQRWEPIQL